MKKRTLILMRHAKSDWSAHGIPDHDRPLNPRGVKAAKLMGRVIEGSVPTVELVFASTAVRVQQTLELMKKEWQRLKPSINSINDLYLASPNSILKLIAQIDHAHSVVLVIGHNPGLEELALLLGGHSVEFPTACVAEFRTTAASWEVASEHRAWELQQVLRPRELE